MRLVAYVRVSGAGQIDAWGLDRQEAAIRKAARRDRHRIVSWERDEGVSGTIEAADRPGLRAAIERLGFHGGERHADGIIVADLDRFARSLTVQETALALVWHRDGQVVTATGGIVHANDPDDPSRALIRQVMGAVVEFEKAQAVRRMRQGRIAKAATGRHAVGSYPFGYYGVGKGRKRDAAPDPEQQPTVTRILELRAGGLSYRQVCATLTEESYRPPRGDQWQPMTVRRIVEREQARR